MEAAIKYCTPFFGKSINLLSDSDLHVALSKALMKAEDHFFILGIHTQASDMWRGQGQGQGSDGTTHLLCTVKRAQPYPDLLTRVSYFCCEFPCSRHQSISTRRAGRYFGRYVQVSG